jgi:hypothetical protein
VAAQGELQLQRNNTERQKNTRLAKVLSYEKLVLTLALNLLPLGSHFRHHKDFHVTWLAGSINVLMGVSCICIGCTAEPHMMLQMFIQFIQLHSHILHLLASNNIFPDYATVSKTIAATYDEGSDCDKAIMQLEESCQMIYDSMVNPDATIFSDVFDDISTHISEQFQYVPLKDIGTKAPKYTISLDNYSNYLVKTLLQMAPIKNQTITMECYFPVS